MDDKSPPSFSAKTLAEELRKLGLHPSEEFPVDDMHIDIAFPEDWIAVEVDGPCHNNEIQKQVDKNRENRLHYNGWEVLRVSANNARQDTEKVAEAIVKYIQANTLRDLKKPVHGIGYRHFNKEISGKDESKPVPEPGLPKISQSWEVEKPKEEKMHKYTPKDFDVWRSSTYKPRKAQKRVDEPKIIPLEKDLSPYSYRKHAIVRGREYLKKMWIPMVISILIIIFLYFWLK
jgi:very-short-patch-repair endonuclease